MQQNIWLEIGILAVLCVVCLAELDLTGNWAIWAKLHAPCTRKESNAPKLKSSQELTVLIYILCLKESLDDLQDEKSDTVGYYSYIINIIIKRNRLILQPQFRLNSGIIPLSSTFFPTWKVENIVVIRISYEYLLEKSKWQRNFFLSSILFYFVSIVPLN